MEKAATGSHAGFKPLEMSPSRRCQVERMSYSRRIDTTVTPGCTLARWAVLSISSLAQLLNPAVAAKGLKLMLIED